MRALVREHRVFVAVLAAGAILRILVGIAFRPGLFHVGDSYAYVELAYGHRFVGFDIAHPSGYPILLHLLSLPGRSIAFMTSLQHVAGLAVGLLVYLLALRLGAPRAVAAAASALVLLNPYFLAVEEFLMSETFFTLALAGGVALAVVGRRPLALGAGGFLVAVAATMRLVALFAAPVWLAYVLVRHRGRPAVAAGAALAVPLAAYLAVHTAYGPGFPLTQFDGWTLYGRIGRIADCRGADIPPGTRALCQTAEQRRYGYPSLYVFDDESPAHRLFGDRVTDRNNRLLREWDRAIIRAHLGPYARVVLSDFLASFRPTGELGRDRATEFPWYREPVHSPIPHRYFPGYREHRREPVGFLLAYEDLARAPIRVLIGAAALLGLAGLLAGPRRAELALLLGCALVLLLIPVATVEFNVRFLVPAIPLLAVAGAAGAGRLVPAARGRRVAVAT